MLGQYFEIGDRLRHAIADHVGVHRLAESVDQDDIAPFAGKQFAQQPFPRPATLLRRFAVIIDGEFHKHQVATAVDEIALGAKDGQIAAGGADSRVFRDNAHFRKLRDEPAQRRLRPAISRTPVSDGTADESHRERAFPQFAQRALQPMSKLIDFHSRILLLAG